MAGDGLTIQKAKEAQEQQLQDLYSERNLLAAFAAQLTWVLGGRVWIGEDPDEPEWPVVYFETPKGQLSWHIRQEELPLFRNVPRGTGSDQWDGHDTPTKLDRLRRMLTDEEP